MFGLVSTLREAGVKVDGNDEVRAFPLLGNDELKATANRAHNTVEEAAGALRLLGDLMTEVDLLPTGEAGPTVTLLAELLDAARLVESDANYELERRTRRGTVKTRRREEAKVTP